MSDALRPHGLQPARLLCPWDSPDKNTGVGCRALLQGDLSDPGIEPMSPALAGGFFTTSATGEDQASKQVRSDLRAFLLWFGAGAGVRAPVWAWVVYISHQRERRGSQALLSFCAALRPEGKSKE